MRLVALALVLLGAAPAPAFRRALRDPVSGTPIVWATRHITWHLTPPGSADVPYDAVVAAVTRAFDAWAGAGCTDMTFGFARGGSMTTNLDGGAPDGINTIRWRETDWPGAPDQIAITTVSFDQDTGRIRDVDIDLNGEYLYFTASDDPARTEYDVESALLHEIGHLLGFEDSDDPAAVMGRELSRGDLVRALAEDDVAGVCTVYPIVADGVDHPVYAACSAGGAATGGGAVALAVLLLTLTALHRQRILASCRYAPGPRSSGSRPLQDAKESSIAARSGAASPVLRPTSTCR